MRARWMLGALGAMATLAMAPAMPASAQAEWGYSTEITNVANGAHWVQSSGPAVESTKQPIHMLGDRAQWNVERQEDGTVTIRNMASNQCAESLLEPNAPVFTAPCNKWDEAQRWSLSHRWDGFVITPASTPHLAVVASSDEYRSTQLVLGVRPYDSQDTPNAVFRLNY
ncbi:hypothetical protein SAMN02982929_06043 [Saccharopolyspora kobensis]|uniref:Ricin B lectin domain-containing protein n=2 Tax=Saccharopolyspora kobensis TaxID=146035 RepID=A0A1H6ECI9_9PSEU|nr:hypothetical protein SAMN02982929_06043 [Saccharopolyspora kobensis]SFD61433.1 hypothetical protein SAMN05216506_105243 [Saccharopolyspora kobensis]